MLPLLPLCIAERICCEHALGTIPPDISKCTHARRNQTIRCIKRVQRRYRKYRERRMRWLLWDPVTGTIDGIDRTRVPRVIRKRFHLALALMLLATEVVKPVGFPVLLAPIALCVAVLTLQLTDDHAIRVLGMMCGVVLAVIVTYVAVSMDFINASLCGFP
jgi:hypothetical protein